MGKMKAKDPQQTPSSPSGIFKTLFGNALEQATAAANSLFSDYNPFRRKPQQHASVSYPTIPSQSPNNDGSGSHDSGEDKKRERPDSGEDKKRERHVVDSDSVTEASEKKRKPGSDERGGEGKDFNLGTETKKGKVEIGGEAGKMKKKRKREELEKEWEEKKYGMVVDGEGDEKEKFGNKTLGSKRKMIVNPAEMFVLKEGFDDEDKLLRTIFVGNLPLKFKTKTLLKEFKKFGEVESVRTCSVPIQDVGFDSADSVHAYIVFKTEESGQASLSHNMTVVEGNHIRVDRTCPPRKKHKGEIASLYDNKRTVFVGNLPFDVKDEELYQLFCGISNLESSIEAVRVIRDPHLNVGKGIAYVLFKTREAANFVVMKRSWKLRDRELRICHAKADATPSKRPNPSPAPSTPSKKLAVASRSPSNSNNRSNKKTNASYQGLRATKYDFKKKVHGRGKPKERMTKRPAVAAKKAKAKLFKDGGTPKQAGVKHKLDSHTPNQAGVKRKLDSGTPKQEGVKRKLDSCTPKQEGVKRKLDSRTPKQAGVKRRLDSRTPDNSLRNKKAKKNNR